MRGTRDSTHEYRISRAIRAVRNGQPVAKAAIDWTVPYRALTIHLRRANVAFIEDEGPGSPPRQRGMGPHVPRVPIEEGEEDAGPDLANPLPPPLSPRVREASPSPAPNPPGLGFVVPPNSPENLLADMPANLLPLPPPYAPPPAYPQPPAYVPPLAYAPPPPAYALLPPAHALLPPAYVPPAAQPLDIPMIPIMHPPTCFQDCWDAIVLRDGRAPSLDNPGDVLWLMIGLRMDEANARDAEQEYHRNRARMRAMLDEAAERGRGEGVPR